MKYIRFEKDNKILYGILKKTEVELIEGDIFGQYSMTSTRYSIESVRLLSPCVPSKVVAVGLNYRDHVKEFGHSMPKEPIIFIKPSTSVIGPDDKIILPKISKQVDYEAELAIVVKKKAKNISVENVDEYILGYTCLNDVTARDLQSLDGQWTRAKGFDTFSPMGPCISTDLNPGNADIKLLLNGQVKQNSNISNFIWNVRELVSFISNVMTLMLGDVITTGTPSGVGPLHVGDCVEVVIEGIGTLRNYVCYCSEVVIN